MKKLKTIVEKKFYLRDNFNIYRDKLLLTFAKMVI